MCLCRELALIGEDLSVEDARLIFMWSRMRVIDEDDPKNRERIENLTFWGFLEAIIRVAQSKALPTDEEVEASGYADGGEFLIKMKRDNPSEYRDFLRANDRQWWEQTRQPIASKLSKLLKLVRDESFWLRETTLILASPAQLDTPLGTEHFLQVQAAKLEEVKGRFTELWTPAVEGHAQQVPRR